LADAVALIVRLSGMKKTFQLQLDALGALICFVVALAYLFWPCHTSIAGYIQDVLKGASR
jgi:hypothetical protein